MRERIHGRMATEATLMFQAIAAGFNGGKLVKDFNKTLESLTNGD